jgi:hypothetical protein
MVAKHGIPTSEDIHKLREPLSLALTSLSDLESHIGNFLLASQRLTRSGQGETPYHYFERCLVTVRGGFPFGGARHDGLLFQVPCHRSAEFGYPVPVPG